MKKTNCNPIKRENEKLFLTKHYTLSTVKLPGYLSQNGVLCQHQLNLETMSNTETFNFKIAFACIKLHHASSYMNKDAPTSLLKMHLQVIQLLNDHHRAEYYK